MDKNAWLGLIAIGSALPLADAGAEIPLPGGSPVPGAVVRDSTGEVVGPVVSFDGKRPVILMRQGSDRFLLTIKEDSSFANRVTLYFDSGDCSGSPVAVDPFDGIGNSGLYDLQDRAYAVGPGNVIFRTTQTSPTTVSVNSRWHSTNSSSQCQSFSDGTFSGVPVEQVDDLDNLFVPPFSVD